MAQRAGSARRYADALFAIAVEQGSIDALAEELNGIAAAVQDAQAMRVLAGPGLTLQRKREIVDALAGPLSRETRSLVNLLLERNRAQLLPKLAEAFATRVRERRGIKLAEVTTAVVLPEPEQEAVASWLAAYFGTQVEIQPRVDPGIIGGVVARVGDQLIDASVRGRLETLKKRLRAGV